jgi:hypothetical protein
MAIISRDELIAASKVSLLPEAVKNLLALHSFKAAWRLAFDSFGGAGFRLYSVKDNMATTYRFVNVVSDYDPRRFELSTWQDAIRRWERLYGGRT